jgi:integrase/recombinase XerD
VRPFVARFDGPDGLELWRVDVAEVRAFVVEVCPRLGRRAAQLTVVALRSLLRFLHLEDALERSLAGAVPSVFGSRLSGLPKRLEPGQVDALLASCDRSTAIGVRDLAILTVLARLGLRAGEVAGLLLEDVDWRMGELVVRGKGGRSERLPLPVDVGEAIVGYLRDGRPSSAQHRAVFVRVRAPHHRLSPGAVTCVVEADALRAGLGQIHAHRLRHTAASEMLRAGATLPEVGRVLRHHRAATTAIYRYCVTRHPEHAATIERVLYLTEPELDALIDAPDRSSWTGRRDHAIIVLLAQTGLRASELTGLRCGDIHLGTGAHATTTGKGRKQRITPLTKETAAALRAWLAERGGQPAEPLFPTSIGEPLTRKALARRIAKHAALAAERCASLTAKTITPHVLRHTAAMRLLHAGVDTTVIALWLGHEQVETTQMYLHADLALKERALARTKPLDSKPGRYRPPDALLRFLDGL